MPLLISNHGGHSGDFCDHASGSLDDIIAAYVERGFRQVSITEHLPPPNDALLYPDEKEKSHTAQFLQDRFARLQTEVRPRLLEKWGQQINLRVGFETEFYGDRPVEWLRENIERYRPETIVASVHHVNNWPIDFDKEGYDAAVQAAGGVDAFHQGYYHHQAELFRALAPYQKEIPVVVGHFDLVKIFQPDFKPSVATLALAEANIRQAIESGFVFEVNSRAFRKKLTEPCPGAAYLELIACHGGRITLGDDSHGPDQVGYAYDQVEPYIRGGFTELASFMRAGKSYEIVMIDLTSGNETRLAPDNLKNLRPGMKPPAAAVGTAPAAPAPAIEK